VCDLEFFGHGLSLLALHLRLLTELVLELKGIRQVLSVGESVGSRCTTSTFLLCVWHWLRGGGIEGGDIWHEVLFFCNPDTVELSAVELDSILALQK